MRLIDADAYEFPGDLVNEPTIDAVPVVRCKDCKYSNIGEEPISGGKIRWCDYGILCSIVADTHYCGYGKRKGEGE